MQWIEYQQPDTVGIPHAVRLMHWPQCNSTSSPLKLARDLIDQGPMAPRSQDDHTVSQPITIVYTVPVQTRLKAGHKSANPTTSPILAAADIELEGALSSRFARFVRANSSFQS